MHILKLITPFRLYDNTVSLGGCTSMTHLDPTLLCKKAPNLSDFKGIPCSQPASHHPTDFIWDSGLDSGLAIPKLKSSSCEVNLFFDLDVCFRALLFWKTKFFFIVSFLEEAWRLCAITDWYLKLFTIP